MATACCAAWCSCSLRRRADAALTEAPRLAAVYDAILDARFDQVDAQLKQACPPAPAEALPGARRRLAVVADSDQPGEPRARSTVRRARRGRHRGQRGVDAARAAARRSVVLSRRRRTRRACSGASSAASGSAPRATARRSRTRSSARSQLDPTLERRVLRHRPLSLLRRRRAGGGEDAAVAALPSRAATASKGLREMLQARDRGELLQGRSRLPAAPRLSLVRAQDRRRRSTLLERLDARYPHNPLFLQRIAEIRDTYLHDHAASAAAWRSLLARARAGTRLRRANDRSARAARPRARLAAMNRSATRSNSCSASSTCIRSNRSARANARSASCARRSREARATRSSDRRATFFDFFVHIVLDTRCFSSIIYIWYEGGELRPSLVRSKIIFDLALPLAEPARKVPRREEGRHRVSVPGGSHQGGDRDRERSRK